VGSAGISVAQNEWNGEAWAHALVDTSTLPAAVCTTDGRIIVSNDASSPLHTGRTLIAAVRALAIDARLSNAIQFSRVHTTARTDDETNRRFDVSVMPVSPTSLLVLGRDTTLESNLVNALAASRQLFRDLALCSNDFAFETDAHAHFTYTSPGAFLGHAAQDLHGSRPRKFFQSAEVSTLFSVRTPLKAREIWTEDKSGNPACIVVTAVPMHDSVGAWCGARGVARDLTDLRLHERREAETRAREDLLSAVVTAMRSQAEPRRMMRAAADAVCAATLSDCVIISTNGAGLDTMIGTEHASMQRLDRSTTWRGENNGRVTLMRSDQSVPWQETEHRLLDAIAPHLGIAIAFASLLQTKTQ
jgi:PAS domain-containing protein